MSDRILQKYIGKTVDAGTEATGPAEVEEVQDFGAFGWLWDSRTRALMLELRKKDGNTLAVGYGWLEKVEFDPSEGITLHAGGQKIKIKGWNLNGEVRPNVRLFRGITRHKVPWIQEADGASALQTGKASTVVENIEW